MKRIDVFLGIKAEQTLRDAARAAAEEVENPACVPELCPIGKKDWIAGERILDEMHFGQFDEKGQAVLRKLIDLKSHQRIRRENLRVYAVKPPVPVFRDPIPEDPRQADQPELNKRSELVICPVCGTEVHNYNIQYDPWGQMVGCYLCRGERRGE